MPTRCAPRFAPPPTSHAATFPLRSAPPSRQLDLGTLARAITARRRSRSRHTQPPQCAADKAGMSESIFAHAVRPRHVRAGRESSSVLVAQPATLHTRTTPASTNDAVCISILAAPLLPHETARVGFLRQEAELRAALSQ